MISTTKIKYVSSFLFMVLGLLFAGQNSFATFGSNLSEVRASMNPAGNHRFVYRMFFRLYDAFLYTDAEQTSSTDELLNGENALLLEFDYLREIKKSIILESSEKILNNNLSSAELASIQNRVDQINAAYRTVDKGDRSALSYIPGEGTTLWINEKPMITIKGRDFARLYFRIWLGEQPISKQMRDALLKPVVAEV